MQMRQPKYTWGPWSTDLSATLIIFTDYTNWNAHNPEISLDLDNSRYRNGNVCTSYQLNLVKISRNIKQTLCIKGCSTNSLITYLLNKFFFCLLFKPISANSSLVQPIPASSSLFQPNPAYSSLFWHILA